MLLLVFSATNQRNIPDLIPRGEERLSVLERCLLHGNQRTNDALPTNTVFEVISNPNQLHCCTWLDTPIILELNIKYMQQHE